MKNDQVIKLLMEEEGMLTRIISEAEKALLKAPEGSVQIRKHKNGHQFYHRRSMVEKNGVYMPKADRKKVVQLVQKRYLQKILQTAGKQKQVITEFLNSYDPAALAGVYENEGEVRQKLLRPFILPDKEYAEAWADVPYEAKSFRDDVPEHYTKKGERVRSKSEEIIADALLARNIPYRYECPLHLGNRVIHPDFTILRIRDRKEIYWENLGMMDDPEYQDHAFRRIRDFESEGIFPGEDLILTVETCSMPLNTKIVNSMIDRYLL